MKIIRPYPLYPLPQDYEELSLGGQKEARLSVLCNHSTPYSLVLAWDFFRRFYLLCSKETSFYGNKFIESPDFHSDMVYALGKYGRNAWGAPRGGAKSTVIGMEIPLLLSLTEPYYNIQLFYSTDEQKKPRFDEFMTQFSYNELIREDFGNLVPRRGEATWNHDLLSLKNGSSIAGGSVMGKKRGKRPNLLIMDDPEYDPESDSETSQMAVIEKFETILFKQLLPMLKPEDCIFWIGTLINRKAFLYRATLGDDTRFEFWNRVVLKAISYDEYDKSKFSLLWPEMWSREYLDAQLESMGRSAFNSEYCNNPVSDTERLLKVDERKNEYTVEGEFNWDNPLSNQNKVIWYERIFRDDNDHRVYEENKRPFNELVQPMFKFILFDMAHGLTTHHDYSCIGVCGIDKLATMWILDLWLGREKEDTLMRLLYEYGLKWNVRVLGIESVSVQRAFAEAFEEYSFEQIGSRNDKWRPKIYPITYPAKVTKGDRIAASEWRFNSGRIKYPAHLREKWPFNQLYSQTADFTKDMALLPFDDAIDAVLGMSGYVVKTKGKTFKRERGKPTLLERIKKGERKTGDLPILSGVPIEQVSDEMIDILSQQARKKKIQPRTRRIERNKPRIIK